MQQIEDGYNEAGPDGLTLIEKRDILARLTHEFVRRPICLLERDCAPR